MCEEALTKDKIWSCYWGVRADSPNGTGDRCRRCCRFNKQTAPEAAADRLLKIAWRREVGTAGRAHFSEVRGRSKCKELSCCEKQLQPGDAYLILPSYKYPRSVPRRNSQRRASGIEHQTLRERLFSTYKMIRFGRDQNHWRIKRLIWSLLAICADLTTPWAELEQEHAAPSFRVSVDLS